MWDEHNNGLHPIPEFLRLYRTFPCLWDVRNNHYRNKKAREVALRQLMAMVGINDVNMLRKRIRSLRCTYNQEIAKMRLAPNFTPKLEWFSFAHSFLRKNDIDYRDEEELGNEVFQITPSSSPYGQFTMHIKEEPDEIWEASNDDVNVEDSMKRKRGMNNDHGESIQSKERKITNSTSQCDACGHSLRYEVDFGAHRNPNSAQTKQDLVLNAPAPLADDFSVFGQYIANQLQLLPLEDSLQLQIEMQSLVVNARVLNARRANAMGSANLNS